MEVVLNLLPRQTASRPVLITAFFLKEQCRELSVMNNFSKIVRGCSRFIPEHSPPDPQNHIYFNKFIENHSQILVLTGAGVSTESGMPDYRSEKVGIFARTSYKPILYSDFMKRPEARRRFWARNFIAWPRFNSFQPNNVHFFVATLEEDKPETRLITQNVDGLHTKAGSKNVLELHGNSFWVICTNCKDLTSRFEFQTVLEKNNPNITATSAEIRPDGDAELPPESVANFNVPCCQKCGGILKPTVIFFGESIPQETVKKADSFVNECDSMLVLGTSLTTLSSYRLVEKAHKMGKFIFIINIGVSRADNLASQKISTRISHVVCNLEKSNLGYRIKS